jgi:hypothetical protein
MWEKAQNRSFSAGMSHSARTASPAATSIVRVPRRRLAGFGHHDLWIIVGKTSGEALVFECQTLAVRRLSLKASKWPNSECLDESGDPIRRAAGGRLG